MFMPKNCNFVHFKCCFKVSSIVVGFKLKRVLVSIASTHETLQIMALTAVQVLYIQCIYFYCIYKKTTFNNVIENVKYNGHMNSVKVHVYLMSLFSFKSCFGSSSASLCANTSA